MDSEGACLMCNGRSFHDLRPAAEKAPSPKLPFSPPYVQELKLYIQIRIGTTIY